MELNENIAAQVAESLYGGKDGKELLGEEVTGIRKDLRPLYFGFKKIILKEIELMDSDEDF